MALSSWLPQLRVYRPFESAREFVRALRLKGQEEWRAYTKTDQFPPDIPADPEPVYADEGWTTWGDWLGSDHVATNKRIYLPYGAAKPIVHGFNLKTANEWRRFKPRLPKNIPAHPEVVYEGKGWIDWPDWLGPGTAR